MVIVVKVLKKYWSRIKDRLLKLNIKSIFKTILPVLFKIIRILCIAIPFILMDLITRMFGNKIDICGLWSFAPNVFSLCWIILFINLSINFKNKIGKKIYLVLCTLFLILFLVHNVYYSITNTFFNFHLLVSTDEGLPYIWSAIKGCNYLVYLAMILIIIFIILGYKCIPKNNKNDYFYIFGICFWCLIIHLIIPISLGKGIEHLSYESWLNPKNNYIAFSDSNKSMKISGLFEYTFRDFYMTYLKPQDKITAEDKEFLDNAFSEYGEYSNQYTGIFKNKNLIFIQLEGMDDWLISEKNTPTLYKMMNNSYNFNNHYSYYSGGGSTFNSEFAVNTGFITPLSYVQTSYTLNKNDFTYSMANVFKKEGYTVNAFHMNSGEFYSRAVNYPNWNYDNYYGLINVDDYDDESYLLDRELILNKKFNKLMFPEDNKFVNFIITYSTHMPFTSQAGVCKALFDLDNTPYNRFVSEEECVLKQAKETDYMMELLLKDLKQKDLLDDTVIVAFTDHYLYTLNNKYILDSYKDTSTNLINHTPFFIWSNDITPTVIDEVTSQIDILPTVLNLFGLYKNPNLYIGKDALDSNYKGLTFFSDYSWYDGNVYVVDGIVKSDGIISQEELKEKNNYIAYITKKNDLALKFNYFKK